MKKKGIPVSDAASAWMQDPEFRDAYNALEEEFTVVSALIKARTEAGLTQEDVARRMGTTQGVIARLEGGRVKPSTRTLERFATATGTRLSITFERKTLQNDRKATASG